MRNIIKLANGAEFKLTMYNPEKEKSYAAYMPLGKDILFTSLTANYSSLYGTQNKYDINADKIVKPEDKYLCLYKDLAVVFYIDSKGELIDITPALISPDGILIDDTTGYIEDAEETMSKYPNLYPNLKNSYSFNKNVVDKYYPVKPIDELIFNYLGLDD